jgi:Ribbon-helix-helix protein, copG family
MQTPLVPGQKGRSPFVGFYLPADLLTALDQEAQRRGLGRSATVRLGIEALLKAQEPDE